MRLARLQTITRIVTLVAAAAAAAVALVAAVAVGQFGLAVAVVVALLVRLRAHTDGLRHAGAVGLVLAVAAVAGAIGGPTGPMLLPLLFIVADYGLVRPMRTVLQVGIAAAVVTAVATAATTGWAAAGLEWVWPLGLVPLIGLTAGQFGGRQSMEGTAALESASAALDEVLALAERMPAGFDRWSVATAVHLEVLEASRLTSRPGATSHLLLVEQGVLFGVGSPVARQPVGLLADLPRQRRGRQWARLDPGQLPTAITGDTQGGRWYLHRLGGDGANGVVVVPGEVTRADLQAIGEVLRPAAVALANVERFEQLEATAISAARTRVAHDLHDGVAQALTHVRFELDLLALEHEGVTDDIARIRRVADAALLEVRRTVGELREGPPLRDRILQHVELLSSITSTPIQVDLPIGLDVPDAAADDLFRFVQEALTNAVRHADATTIRVALAQDEHGISAVVVDDGRGMAPGGRRGVGIGAMRNRARRLGGELTIRPRRGGGTVLELEAPIRSAAALAADARGEAIPRNLS